MSGAPLKPEQDGPSRSQSQRRGESAVAPEHRGSSEAEQAHHNLERSKIAFEALFRLFEKIGTTFDLDGIVRVLLLTVMGQLAVKRIACFLLDADSKRFELCRALGVGRTALPTAAGASSAFRRWLRAGDPHRHIDGFFTGGAGALTDETGRFLATLAERGFAYALSLTDHEEPLGALFYSGNVTGKDFSRFDRELLRMLARVASIAIKNAALYREAVRSKREIERFAKIKKEFIDHTSHELRTPITVLKSALWSVEPEEGEGGVLVDMAKDAVVRLHEKIEQLLSLNAVELDGTSYERAPTDVSALLEDCLREVIAELEAKQVTVSFDDRACYREIMVDASKMKLVFRSIIDNAMTFVDRGGTIGLETELVEEPPGEGEGVEIANRDAGGITSPRSLPCARESESPIPDLLPDDPSDLRLSSRERYFVIRITDNGIGIPAGEIAFIAEPFKRASNSTLRNVKGLGIGLTVSQRIIAGHGGRLFCRSGEGSGAMFSIWLPAG